VWSTCKHFQMHLKKKQIPIGQPSPTHLTPAETPFFPPTLFQNPLFLEPEPHGDLVLTSSLANHTKYATKTHEYLSGTTKNGEKQQGNWDLKMLTIFVCPLVFGKWESPSNFYRKMLQ